MMKLLVVDDSELIRSRLIGMLRGMEGVKEVGAAASVQEALYTTAHFLPSLVILDLNLPDGHAFKIIPLLRRMVPGMRIAVLTNDASDFNRERCLRSGADWFFDKSTQLEQLMAVLQEQAHGSTLH